MSSHVENLGICIAVMDQMYKEKVYSLVLCMPAIVTACISQNLLLNAHWVEYPGFGTLYMCGGLQRIFDSKIWDIRWMYLYLRDRYIWSMFVY